MEKIVIEVDKRIAKAWQKASEKKKKEIGNKVSISLAKELMKTSLGENEMEYLDFLYELRVEMAEKGLTQQELDKI